MISKLKKQWRKKEKNKCQQGFNPQWRTETGWTACISKLSHLTRCTSYWVNPAAVLSYTGGTSTSWSQPAAVVAPRTPAVTGKLHYWVCPMRKKQVERWWLCGIPMNKEMIGDGDGDGGRNEDEISSVSPQSLGDSKLKELKAININK